MEKNRKNVFALACCQALLVMNNAMMISVGTLAADTLALPIHQGLERADLEYVSEKIRRFYQ